MVLIMQANLFRRSAILIENNHAQIRLYEDLLTANGFDVYVAKSPMDGLLKIKETPIDIVVVDVDIAEDGFMTKFITKIKSEEAMANVPIIGLSIYSETSIKNIAKMLDIFLTKPISIDTFTKSVFYCLENKFDDCSCCCS